MGSRDELKSKMSESALSVLPIIVIAVLLSLTITPVPTDTMLSFLAGSVFVIAGIALFSLGADMSMTQIGSRIGGAMTKTRSLPLMLLVSFILGFAVTIAEPDLMVLANTVPTIKTSVLLITVGVGVGFFLMICILRIFLGIKLRTMLLVFYAIVFVLAFMSDSGFHGVAFDSGGVTTGPMTVPFILALGVGVANIRNDAQAEKDSFGLVALCSIGPILAVLILGFIYNGDGELELAADSAYADTAAVGKAYLEAIPGELKQMAMALAPIVVIFALFQTAALRLGKSALARIVVGLVYTYAGLVLFLSGVNVGFSSLGFTIGSAVASDYPVIFVILAGVLGWFIISAEPAVSVLEKQIEEVSAGAIPGRAIKLSLSVAIALAMALSALRIVCKIPVMYFLLPGYILALVLSFLVPDIYTAIAFDSGGVASGPMTATFMLMFMIGAAQALGRDVVADAFGVVSMVAMMPLISIQLTGLLCTRRGASKESAAEEYGDYDIIELWEE